MIRFSAMLLLDMICIFLQSVVFNYLTTPLLLHAHNLLLIIQKILSDSQSFSVTTQSMSTSHETIEINEIDAAMPNSLIFRLGHQNSSGLASLLACRMDAREPSGRQPVMLFQVPTLSYCVSS